MDNNADSSNNQGFVEIDSNQIPESDIVFKCSHCGKQHSIDPRGAGLTITCTACDDLITVPIPEEVRLSDLDADPESADALIIHLRKALNRSEARIRDLEAQREKVRTLLEIIAPHQIEITRALSTIHSAMEEKV